MILTFNSLTRTGARHIPWLDGTLVFCQITTKVHSLAGLWRDKGIAQTADAANNNLLAEAVFGNDGALTISAIAIAGAQATTVALSRAEASVSMSSVIFQNAKDAAQSAVNFTNTGTVEMLAQVQAVGDSDAEADADLNSGIYQQVNDGDILTASVLNSGSQSLDFLVRVTATADSADASASMNLGIYQRLSNGDEAYLSLDNSGSINIVAEANAFGKTTARAEADNDAIWQRASSIGAISELELTNDGALNIQAVANAVGASQVMAGAEVSEALQQSVFNSEQVTTNITNTGELNIIAVAQAYGSATSGYAATASAVADIEEAIYAYANGNAGSGANAAATFSNTGSLSIELRATAIAKRTSAYANAEMSSLVEQFAGNADTASVVITNSGTLDVIAEADAFGRTQAIAEVSGEDVGIRQIAETTNNNISAIASISNSGSLIVSGDANALAQAQSNGNATADATFETVFYQHADNANTASVSLTNSSTLSISNTARAEATGASGVAIATAEITNAIYQEASADGGAGSLASAYLDNSGTLELMAVASAVASSRATARAELDGNPIDQVVTNGSTALAEITNSSTLSLSVGAFAEAFDASAFASAAPVYQSVSAVTGGDATASFENSSSFIMRADARALGQHGGQTTTSASARASAHVHALTQSVAGGGDPAAMLRFTNSSIFGAYATATASANAGTTANASTAYAFAFGYVGDAGTGKTADIDFSNTGTFEIMANARLAGAGSKATAQAFGIHYTAESMTGTFDNSGSIRVVASSVRVDSISATSPNTTVIGTATAIALQVETDSAGADLANSGTISAYAVASVAKATAVRFDDYLGGGAQTANFINDGGTIEAVTNDGSTDMRGTAFNTEGANYDVVLVWRGTSTDGSIFGDAEIDDVSFIIVDDGTTRFDGIVNPDDVNEGFLYIFNDGKLALANNADLGPSQVNVNEFEVRSRGTLGIEIDPLAAASIDANTASLDGTIMVSAVAGLYADTQTYDDVIDAGTLTGTFDVETTNSALLDLSVHYDGNTVDLAVNRTAFNAVAGLTANQLAIAGGIESTYSTALSGDYGGLVAELFTLGSGDYADALDQLSGSEYAGVLQAAAGSFNQFLDAVNRRADASRSGGPSTNASPETPLVSGAENAERGNVWAYAGGSWASQDGDGNSQGYTHSAALALFGVDAQVSDQLLIGLAGGIYTPGDLKFDNGNRVDQDNGYQVGAYAQYDTGQYYLRGFAGYGAWNATSSRSVSAGSYSGNNSASFDVSAWNITGEGGYDFDFGTHVITPYGGLSYTYASLDDYSESGSDASALSGDGGGGQLDGYLGLRLSGMAFSSDTFSLMPQAAAGVVHNFSDEAEVTNTLISAPAGTSFTVLAPQQETAAFLDVGATMFIKSNAQLSMSYLGEYGASHQEHGGFLKFKVNF
ncbi:autotransporter outer membrane beta-barrel domain-containing protein [Roseibium sp. SCP14]|uniref:autotransporter outer membrane beta-barrel domain-containing protein n=1 Tax=Roseibium sp. SCP14 TaxID=3141375 RepID=UPI003337CEA7